MRRTEAVSPRLIRVTLGGPALDGLVVDQPAASVRVLLPEAAGLVLPEWNGNQFLLPDGGRPKLRTLTPRRLDAGAAELDVEIVIHVGGAASAWAAAAQPGDPVGLTGPGRGYAIDAGARTFLLAGDESAIPAMSQLLEWLPSEARVDVHVEAADRRARIELPAHERATIAWHELPAGAPPGAAMVNAVAEAPIAAGTRVWVAGEAAAVQRIRRHLFEDRGHPRADAWVRGYWKHGRAGDDDAATDAPAP